MELQRWGNRSGRWSRRGVLAMWAVVLVVAFVVAAGVVAGSSSSRIIDTEPAASPAQAGTQTEGGAAAPSTGFAADAARSAAPEQADAAAPAVPAPGAPAAPGVPVGAVDRTLVRTAQVEVEVDDPAAAGRQVRTAVAAAGGFVTEEQAGTRGALLVVRVPVAALDRLLDDVATIGTVVERSGQVVDVTEEAVDLDARVASQQASVARVRALLAQAESIGDVVAIESELARREAELDSLTSRLTVLRDQAALSTLTVDLRPVDAEPGADDRALGFGDGLGAGWDGLRALGLAVAVVVGFVLPFLPLLAVLAGLAWLARRRLRLRRP
ncbi:MAG: DUF4349 domain-containing protein [Pseudonocardia sp.]